MTATQIESADVPDEFYALMSRAELLGLLPPAGLPSSPEVSARLGDLARAMLAAGVATTAARRLLDSPRATVAMRRFVAVAMDALAQNPLPSFEWPVLRTILGDRMLARLTGVSEVSLRRYALSHRTTPDDVATRLHWVAGVVADLRGSYTDTGIRRWFLRPRTALDGQSPIALLEGSVDPDGAPAARVRALAHALTNLGAA